MTGSELRQGRRTKKWTQGELAEKLGISQAYVSLLEKNRRPVPESLARKAVSLLDLPASTLPVRTDAPVLGADEVARALGSLGYTGFAHLPRTRKLNPAELLMRALNSQNVEARLVEALAWLLVNYPNMDWPWLVRMAKQNDLQNRLGFLVSVAREVARTQGHADVAQTLAHWESVLENSRLQKEDAFAQDALTQAERAWLRNNRSDVAARWNLLTGISAAVVASGS
jgi:transcriptional regulator with XRE-family HTH domain